MSLDAGKLMDCTRLAERLGISLRTLGKRRSAGEILDPLWGSGKPRWVEKEVEAWIIDGRPCATTWRRRRERWVRSIVAQ